LGRRRLGCWAGLGAGSGEDAHLDSILPSLTQRRWRKSGDKQGRRRCTYCESYWAARPIGPVLISKPIDQVTPVARRISAKEVSRNGLRQRSEGTLGHRERVHRRRHIAVAKLVGQHHVHLRTRLTQLPQFVRKVLFFQRRWGEVSTTSARIPVPRAASARAFARARAGAGWAGRCSVCAA